MTSSTTATTPVTAPTASSFAIALTKTAALWAVHVLVFILVTFTVFKTALFYDAVFTKLEMDFPAAPKLLIAVAQRQMVLWIMPGSLLLLFDAGVLFILNVLGDRWRSVRAMWFTSILLGAILFLCWSLVAFSLAWHDTVFTLSS